MAERRSIILCAIFAFLLAAVGGFRPVACYAAPPQAPRFMPGFPILAGGQAMLMWTPVPGVKEYKVYKNGVLLTGTPATQFFDQLGEAAGEYNYELSSVGLDGVEGPKSPAGQIKIMKITAPKDLVTRVIGETVGLRWEPVQGVAVYNVFRAEGKDVAANYKLLTSVTSNSFSDSNVKQGNTYFYKVSARDLGGKESPYSSPVSIKLEEEKAAAAEKILMIRTSRRIHEISNGLDVVSMKNVDMRSPNDVEVGKTKIYVSRNGRSTVAVFDKERKGYLFEIGTDGKVEDESKPSYFRQLGKIRLDPAGTTLYVSDPAEKTVYRFEAETGKLLGKTVPKQPEPPEKPYIVYFFSVDKEGGLWISDPMNQKIRVYDAAGNLVRAFGNKDQISGPGDAVIDFERKRFSVINGNKASLGISVFDLDGKFLRRFGNKGTVGGTLWAPTGIALLPDGNLLQADGIFSTINVFDPGTGEVVYYLKGETGKEVVQVTSARGLRADGELIYVANGTADYIGVIEMFGKPRLP